MWSLSDDYRNVIKEQEGLYTAQEWKELLLKSDESSRVYEKEGSFAYNTAIIIMIFGLFLAIAPYQFIVAIVVAIISIY